MNDEELREYAEFVIKDHAKEIEFISLFEMFELWAEGEYLITEEEAHRVDELISQAKVTVEW